MFAALATQAAFAADSTQPIETIEVRGSLAEVREQVQTFVTQVTRKEGELIGRWDKRICPMIAGISDDQAAFMRHRLLEIEAEARKRTLDEAGACKANVFVIITQEPDQVLADWKARDPSMFRWKTREGITRSTGEGPVRTWHNAVEVPTGPANSRIVSPVSEFIQNVVVLVDGTRTGGKSLAQITDYVALVSLSQIDPSADPHGVQSILQSFLPVPSAPTALTDWDLALLHGLYRTSYSPKHQRMDLMARMSRELAPRGRSNEKSASGVKDAPALAAIANEPLALAAAPSDPPAEVAGAMDPPVLAPSSSNLPAPAAGPNDRLETVLVRGSRAEVRKQVETFVSQVTRMDGDLIGRWRDSLCPWIVGLSDSQNAFIRNRLVEVEAKVRKRKPQPDRKCQPNLFVIITGDAEGVLADWKERDPSMFRWKTREGISRSEDAGPVRIWHNAIELRADDGPWVYQNIGPARAAKQGRLQDSRIKQSAKEAITAVVVLLDVKKTGPVTLVQTADYLAMVSLSQVDLKADLGATNTILKLFAEARAGPTPAALTDWDYAFLNALYRVGYYSPMHQRMDISARMSRELAPR